MLGVSSVMDEAGAGCVFTMSPLEVEADVCAAGGYEMDELFVIEEDIDYRRRELARGGTGFSISIRIISQPAVVL